MNTRLRRWMMLIIPLLAVGFVLAACDGADEEGGGGGLGQGTVVSETPEMSATDVITAETPIDATPTTEITPTVEMTATTEVTPEVTVEATEVITEHGTADTMGLDAVILASDFIDADVHNPAGKVIGAVWEALADEEGTIQYVLVNKGALSAGGDDAYPTGAVTGTTNITTTNAFELVALPWNGFEVQLNDETEETDDIMLVYNGKIDTVEAEPLDVDFLDFLDEDGFVLQDDPDSDFAPPAEFVGLIQISDYDDYELRDTADNDLGDTEDLLIDMRTGQILYAVTDVGGFLGIGANSIAIPWDALTLEVVGDEDERTETFTLDITEEFLTEAPTIDLGDWKPLVDNGWDEEITTYWESMTTS